MFFVCFHVMGDLQYIGLQPIWYICSTVDVTYKVEGYSHFELHAQLTTFILHLLLISFFQMRTSLFYLCSAFFGRAQA